MNQKIKASQSKPVRKPVVLPESDIKLVQGLIDRNPESEQAFIDQYRERIYFLFVFAHERMKIKAKLTDQLKEDLFNAFCENLHSSEDQQLKDFLAGEKESTLTGFLTVKSSFFCRDMLLVKGLKDGDKEITKRLFYGMDKKDSLSFQPIMKNALNARDIRNYEKGGERMSSVDFASDMYDQLMTRLNQDKFRFESSLKTYFANVVRTRLNQLIEDKNRDFTESDIDDYAKSKASNVATYIDYEREEVSEFYDGLFDVLVGKGMDPKKVEVLKDWYLGNLSAKEIAEKWGITENLVSQWVFRTKGELRKTARELI